MHLYSTLWGGTHHECVSRPHTDGVILLLEDVALILLLLLLKLLANIPPAKREKCFPVAATFQECFAVEAMGSHPPITAQNVSPSLWCHPRCSPVVAIRPTGKHSAIHRAKMFPRPSQSDAGAQNVCPARRGNILLQGHLRKRFPRRGRDGSLG